MLQLQIIFEIFWSNYKKKTVHSRMMVQHLQGFVMIGQEVFYVAGVCIEVVER